MEPLRDWLIRIGWSKQSAAAASITVAVLVSYLVGWGFRLLARVPLYRFLRTSEAWREAVDRWRVVPHTARVAVVITGANGRGSASTGGKQSVKMEHAPEEQVARHNPAW